MLDNTSGLFGMDGQVAAQTTVEEEDVMIIAASGLFDEAWYIKENPDVARSGLNPLFHYVRFGASEGRVPLKGFNAARYVANMEEREPVTRNPLAHFVLHGGPDDLLSKGLLAGFSTSAIKLAMDRLNAMPIFKPDEYITLNEDIKTPGGHLDVPLGTRPMKSLETDPDIACCHSPGSGAAGQRPHLAQVAIAEDRILRQRGR